MDTGGFTVGAAFGAGTFEDGTCAGTACRGAAAGGGISIDPGMGGAGCSHAAAGLTGLAAGGNVFEVVSGGLGWLAGLGHAACDADLAAVVFGGIGGAGMEAASSASFCSYCSGVRGGGGTGNPV